MARPVNRWPPVAWLIAAVLLIALQQSANCQDFTSLCECRPGSLACVHHLTPAPAVNGSMASVVCATRDNVNIRLFGNPVGEIMPTSRISVSPPLGTLTMCRVWTFNPILLSDEGGMPYSCSFGSLDVTVQNFEVTVPPSNVSVMCSVYGQTENGTLLLGAQFPDLLSESHITNSSYLGTVQVGRSHMLVCLVSVPTTMTLNPPIWHGERLNKSSLTVAPGTSTGNFVPSVRRLTSFQMLAILTIKSATEQDAGTYTLTVLDAANRTVNFTSCNRTLDVNCRYPVFLQSVPQIVSELENFEADNGGVGTATCEAIGVPRPTIQWFKDAEPLATEDRRFFIVDTVPDAADIFRVKSTLTIAPVEYGDRAHYSCSAVSAIGATRRSALFRVRDPLGPLWPFFGILGQFFFLLVLLYWDRYRREAKLAKKTAYDQIDGESEDETDGKDEPGHNEHLSLLFRCPRDEQASPPRVRYDRLAESVL